MPTGGGSDDEEVGAELDGGLPSAEVDGIPGGGEVTGVEPLIYPDGVERSHLRVLCAEDHLFERTAIAHLFKSTNEQYRASNLPLQLAVQLVPSMDGVMQAIAEAPPDEAFHIILLDVNLDRGRTSEEIIGWIREKVGEKVPIVLFSATAHMDTVRAAATRAAGPARGPPRAHTHTRNDAHAPPRARAIAGAAVPAARRRRVRHEAAAARLLHAPVAVLPAARPRFLLRHRAEPPAHVGPLRGRRSAAERGPDARRGGQLGLGLRIRGRPRRVPPAMNLNE